MDESNTCLVQLCVKRIVLHYKHELHPENADKHTYAAPRLLEQSASMRHLGEYTANFQETLKNYQFNLRYNL